MGELRNRSTNTAYKITKMYKKNVWIFGTKVTYSKRLKAKLKKISSTEYRGFENND